VDKETVGQFSGQRGRWLILLEKETVGQFWWIKRQVANFGGK